MDQTKQRPPNEPWRPGRREFIIGGAAALAAIIFGINKRPNQSPDTSPQISNPYSGWEKYVNRTIPEKTVLAIANNLTADTEYPGFSEVGSLLALAITKPGQFTTDISPLHTTEPITISLNPNFQKQTGALAALSMNIHEVTLSLNVKRKGSDQTRQELFTRLNDNITLNVILDNGVAIAPEAAKKLLLVKELSHLLLIAEQKQAIVSEVLQNYEIKVANPALRLEDILYSSGMDKADRSDIPSLGDLFDNTRIDLDGAGYWYITRAFGKMKAMGLFNNKDLDVLESNDSAFQTALRRGLLIDQGRGNYVWREGIGPFSPEWTAIGRAVLRGEYQKLS